MYQSSSTSSLVHSPMDVQLKELLHIHRSKFAQIDVERLIPLLKDTGQLNQDDIDTVRRTSGQKIQTLLDIIPSKGSQAFQTLCLALENTSPHLLTVMLMAAVQQMQFYYPSRQGSASAGLTSDSECEDKKSTASSTGGEYAANATGKSVSPPQPNLISSHDYNMEQSNVALLKSELKIVTKDRDVMKKELKKVIRERDELAKYPVTDQSSNYSTLNSVSGDISPKDWDTLRLQYERSLSDMQAIKKQNLEMSRKYDTALKDIEYYRNKERSAYTSLQTLRLQLEEVSAEKQKLEHEVTSLQSIMDDERKEMADVRRQQQEAMTQEGSGDAINQIYLSTLRKYEDLKEEYDSLHKRYADTAASHSNYASKLELAQEEISRMQVCFDQMNQDRHKLKVQCTQAIQRWSTELYDKNLVAAELLKIQDKHKEAIKDKEEHLKQRQSLDTNLKRLQEERNAAMTEYTLVMSERNSVHTEMEQLQEELAKATKTIKSIETNAKDTTKEKESLQLQLETLKREIASSLHDRDKAVREVLELRDRYGAKDDTNKEWEHSYKDYNTLKLEREQKFKEGSEQATGVHDLYTKTQKERHENLDQANQEVDRLRKNIEKLQSELQEAKREAEVSKRRRDWAFSERDKIVLERESIRAHCDKLRHERDRAVSDLAEALRDSDDMTKQRNEAEKQLKEIKERLETEQDKCVAARQLTAHNNSRDSAIDTELHEWELDTMNIPTATLSHRDIGFEICGGSEDPHYGSNDGSVFVSAVSKDGPFNGKLRLHDQLIRINGTECQGASYTALVHALFSAGGWAHVTVRRRKSNHNNLHTAHIHCAHASNHGIILHSGIYIGSILAGSPAAKEGSLSPGDKLIKVNGKLVDNLLTADEATTLIGAAGEMIQLTTVRGLNTMSAPLSSSSSGHNMTEDEKSASSRHYSSPTCQSKESSASPSRLANRELKLPPGLTPAQLDDLGRRLSSSERVVYNVNKGMEEKSSTSGPWGQFKNIVKPRRHSKERPESREKEDKKKIHLMSLEQEKALAELDLVINSYRPKPVPVALPVNTGTAKRPKKKEKEKTGGTWPKYRRGAPTLRDINSGTIKTSQWKKERPPLSMYLPGTSGTDMKVFDAGKKNTLPRNFNSHLSKPVSPRSHVFSIYNSSDNSSFSISYNSNDHRASPHYPRDHTDNVYPNPDIFCSLSTRAASVNDHKAEDSEKEMGHHSSPDTSLDFSVRSGNVGQEELEYYVKKNRGKYPPSDSESNLSPIDPAPLQPSSLPPAYMARPLPQHTKIVPPYSRHLHSSLYTVTNSALRVTPTYPHMSFPSQYNHSHPHTTLVSPIYSSTPPHYTSPPPLHLGPTGYMSPSRSGDSILSSPGLDCDPRDPRSYYENQIISSAYGSMGGFPHSASPSTDLGGGHYRVKNLHPHSKRASSDEPPNNIHPLGPPSYRDYQRSVATMPRHKDRMGGHLTALKAKPSLDPGCDRLGGSSSERSSPSYGGELASCTTSQSGSSLNRGSQPVTEIFYSIHNQHYNLYKPPSKPASMELRKIVLEKENEPLGIQIRCLDSGGVFVSSVKQNSLAELVGMCVGDQLLEICGINMRSAQKSVAQTVLSQCRTSVIILVQFNPEKYQETDFWEECSSGGSIILGSRSATPTPRNSPIGRPLDSSHDSANEEDLPPSGSSTLRAPLDTRDFDLALPASTRSTLTRPQAAHMLSLLKRQETLSRRSNTSANSNSPSETTSVGKSSPSDKRHVYVEMTKSQNIGIQMVGGNAVGIFIHSVIADSPAAKCGLRSGDRILEYNNVDLRQATAEYAAFELAKPAENVSVVIKHDMQKYTDIKDKPGDSFHIRSLIDRAEVSEANELKFEKDTILYVDNTMFGNMPGLWRAWIVDHDGDKTECGTIPSKDKIEEDIMAQRNVDRRGATNARRSFFRRKKNSRSSSRDSKELASFSDASLNAYTDTAVPDDPLAYIRVKQLEYMGIRPVLLVGPLCEMIGEKVCIDFNSTFQKCNPHFQQCSQADMNQSMKNNDIVDYRRRGNFYEIIYGSQVNELCQQGYHAMLDVNVSAIDHLQRLKMYPIVILLKYKHSKHIRDISDTIYPTTDRLSHKEAKEMFDLADKLQQQYKPFVTAEIDAGANVLYICSQVRHMVQQEQNRPIWIPSDIL